MNCILQKVKRKKKCRTHSFSNLFLSFINPHIFSSNSLNWTWYLHKGHVALLLCQFTIQLEWNLCTYLSILPSSPTFVSFWQTPQTAPSFLITTSFDPLNTGSITWLSRFPTLCFVMSMDPIFLNTSWDHMNHRRS